MSMRTKLLRSSQIRSRRRMFSRQSVRSTRSPRAMITDLQYRLDVNTLRRDESAMELELNEIGRIRMRTTSPLLFDEYRRNRDTGSLILIDEGTNATVGAGMITGEAM